MMQKNMLKAVTLSLSWRPFHSFFPHPCAPSSASFIYSRHPLPSLSLSPFLSWIKFTSETSFSSLNGEAKSFLLFQLSKWLPSSAIYSALFLSTKDSPRVRHAQGEGDREASALNQIFKWSLAIHLCSLALKALVALHVNSTWCSLPLFLNIK